MSIIRFKPLLIVTLLLSQTSYAQDNYHHCRVIHWQPDRIYILNGSINKATHILFNTEKSVDPIIGNSDLWQVEAAGNHVFFKPTNKKDADGKETTMTFIGHNQHSYEFILRRVDNVDSSCIIIKDDTHALDKHWQHYQQHEQQQSLQQEKRKRTTSPNSKLITEQTLKLQNQAVRYYRSQIHTGYRIYKHTTWFDPNIIDSIYDDGRWTYLRLKHDNKGLMTIYGEVSGQKVLLQSDYDAFHKMYQISGIYPKLICAQNKDKIEIIRYT